MRELNAVRQMLKRPDLFINTAGQLSLSEFAALASRLECFVAADTGPLYIADALGTPLVDIMGPCASASQRPTGPRALVVGECANQNHIKSYIMYSPNYHRDEYLRCMDEVDFVTVWNGVKQNLSF